jgi:hypothetical protein
MWWLNPKNGIDAVKLKDWRGKERKTQQWVSDRLNEMAEAEGDQDRVSQSSVDRWEKGTIPRQANMRRVMKLTDQAVTFADFYGDGGPPKRKSRDPKISQQAARKAASVRRAQREALT